jgi:hypothetical protein
MQWIVKSTFIVNLFRFSLKCYIFIENLFFKKMLIITWVQKYDGSDQNHAAEAAFALLLRW